MLQYINKRRNLDEGTIRVIGAQVIQCLIFLHRRGVIYGDLKAENILISHNGTIKLCDFNLSGTQSVLGSTLQGTMCYLSPEMLEGDARTPKSDFWSLGVLLHLLFYRKYPFIDKHSSALLGNILNVRLIKEPSGRRASNSFRRLIKDLFIKNPKRRIGARIEDFKQHPFFEGFEWESYFRIKRNFAYAEDYSRMDKESESKSVSSEGDSMLLDLKDKGLSQNQTNYNIEGFTYETNFSRDRRENRPTIFLCFNVSYIGFFVKKAYICLLRFSET